jgi:octaprenyl-diphosphate synthase
MKVTANPSNNSVADQRALNGFQEVYEPVKEFLRDLDRFLLDQVQQLEPEVQEHVSYVLGHSGKRLRPILVAYSACGGPAYTERYHDVIKLAAVVEFVHLATLVHDDILDEADMRHRQATVAHKYGAAAAVLVGDVLFAHALSLAAEFETTEVCRCVAQATARVCAGEVSQTYQRGTVNYDRAHYYRVIDLKTAELFAVSCYLGSRVAGHSEEAARSVELFGRKLGCAYQMLDDLVDLCADEASAGKTLGTDLQKGKFTLPLLMVIEKLSDVAAKQLLEQFNVDAAAVVAQFNTHIEHYGIFAAMHQEIEAELVAAAQSLATPSTLQSSTGLLKLSQLVRLQLGRIQPASV